MTVSELLRENRWSDVKAALLWLFADARNNLGEYQRVFRLLRGMAPLPDPMRISIQSAFREGVDDEPFNELVGRNGTLTRDLEDFKHLGYSADSRYALEEAAYSIALEPWENWLGMAIDPETMTQFSAPQIIAHCLWEMTFHGFTPAEVQEVRNELNRRVAELDAMTDEERKQKLIPADEVMKKLKEKWGVE